MRISRLIPLALLALTHSASPAIADIYMYRDSRGGLHFSNAPAEPKYRYYMAELDAWKTWRRSPFGRRWSDPKRHKKYDEIIREAADRHRVEVALVKAVIRAESDFQADAVSPKGALGLMQLMPATARMRGVNTAFEPSQNVEGGVRHLKYLLDLYSGNVRLALAAYNAGEGAVKKSGGIPPYPETWAYLDKVLRFREGYLQK